MMSIVETMIAAAKETGKAAAGNNHGVEQLKALSPNEIGDLAKKGVENVKEPGDAVICKLTDIQGLTPEQLMEKMNGNLESLRNGSDEDVDKTELADGVRKGLTDEEKVIVRKETGWSDEVLDNIGPMAEYEIYKKAGLIEVEIGGKKCLIRLDIDWDKKWETGKYDENGKPIYETNRERIAKGKAPLDANGNPIQLHHIGQHADSPLAELTFEEHRCGGNDKILHDKPGATETHGEGNTWDQERQDYWKNRSKNINGGVGNA